jgi:dienelactone hydrolase
MSCPDCLSGRLHDGHAQGEETKLHGLDVYVTGPPVKKAKGIIVVITDAFGWKLPNSRFWADEVAKKGEWNVLVPDFMNGMYDA